MRKLKGWTKERECVRAGERDFGGKIRERGGEDKKRVKRERGK